MSRLSGLIARFEAKLPKERRETLEFLIKNIVIVVVAIWTLCITTAFLQKQSAEIFLRSQSLSNVNNPVADTTLAVNFISEPYGGNEDYCTISGLYSIKNTGTLHIDIEAVRLTLYKIAPQSVPRGSRAEVISNTLLSRQREWILVYEEPIDGRETIGVGNSLERSFQYFVNRRLTDNPHLYFVVANATGGVLNSNSINNSASNEILGGFHHNDLRHISGLSFICPILPSVSR